jgi:hypothetical protein
MRKVVAALIVVLVCYLSYPRAFAQSSAAVVKANPLRDAYYGDLHLHTSYSFDAYLVAGAASVDPDEAYRFARGEAADYLGRRVQRREPLDFLAVTDHAENIGVFNALEDPNSAVSHSDVGKAFRALQADTTSPSKGREAPAFLAFYWDYFLGSRNRLPDSLKPESASAWAREIDFANRNYQPGKFTTFIAYEWTSNPYGANLHRNIIFRGDSAPNPFTAFDSKRPEDLWDWLETIRRRGFEAIAIPHNGNWSNGLMYDWVDSDSQPIGCVYALERQANEPLSEISQTKGSSETHPLLSPSDEFADFQIYDVMPAARHYLEHPSGSYLRDALSRGLVLQRQVGSNPFKYGFVGGSDLHTGLSLSAQADYEGTIVKANIGGGRPSKAEASDLLRADDVRTTSGNLTGVWAESNTRESIYSGLRRRETFATSGTRLKFRFFGGWSFVRQLLREKNWIADAYREGVPMGGDLPARPRDSEAPTFAIWAVKDPNGANLDRAQVIKVWEERGEQREKVFDVAWSGLRSLDPKTGKLRAVGNTVDPKSGTYTNTIGAVQLETVWSDPEFDPKRYAAYYLRLLEIPTPRWSTLLAIQYGLPLPQGVPATEQQRGWSSPIWYSPPAN